jgi:hypothetical protein
MTDFNYVGTELDVFAHAVRWKSYFRSQVQPYIRGDVLEVGAGIGATTALLCDGSQTRWVCLEPDRLLASRILCEGALSRCEVRTGTTADLRPAERFDCILYIDVLEHIEHDRHEMAKAANHLKSGGFVVVLSPAHQWLYTPFDRAIGHYRRYTKSSLRAAADVGLREVKLVYLDSVGLVASLGNKLLLQSATPNLKQILTWDRLMVPLSRIIDPLLLRSVGKSIVGVWQRH